MKKAVFILIGILYAGAAIASPVKTADRLDRVRSLRLPARHTVDLERENNFGDTPVFSAALKGDVAALRYFQSVASDGGYLLRAGKNGNNVLHVARDLKTFDALVAGIKHFYPQTYRVKVTGLLEQKNQSLETPLRTHLNYGQADIFLKYFRVTSLYERMGRVRNDLARGGIAAEVAKEKANKLAEDSKDISGLTAYQAAALKAERPGMRQVMRAIEQQAPYLAQ